MRSIASFAALLLAFGLPAAAASADTILVSFTGTINFVAT